MGQLVLTAFAFALGGAAIGFLVAWRMYRIALGREAAVLGAAADRHSDTARELAASTVRLAEAMDGSRLAMWELDMRTGEVNLSPNWFALMGGIPRESPIPIAELIDRVPDGEQADCWEAVRAVLRGSSSFYDVEHRVRRDDGSLVWIQSRGAVSERAADGRVLRMTGTNFDITARKTAELALEQGKSTLRLVADTLGVRVFILDADLCVRFASTGHALDAELERLVRSRLDELRTGVVITWARGEVGEVRLMPHLEGDELVRITVVAQSPRSSSFTQSRNALTFGASAASGGHTNQ